MQVGFEKIAICD